MPGSRVPPLGPRGEGWVVLQALALAAVALAPLAGSEWPGTARLARLALGAALVGAGLLLLAAGVRALGPELTPFPRPRAGAAVRTEGVYRLVRHPIYGGILLAAAGWALATSPLALAPAAALAALFAAKARREEAWLEERHPHYAGYREQTPRRFVPWVL